MDNQHFAKAFMWMKDGTMKASYMAFYTNFNKNGGSTEALEYKRVWDKYVQEWNAQASPPARGAFHTSKLWQQAEAREQLIASTVMTLVVLVVLSFISMLCFTKDFTVATYVVSSTIWVICMLLFFMVCICQWKLGPIESIALIVFIGYALTYSLHIGHKYSDYDPELDTAKNPDEVVNNPGLERLQRTSFALRFMGGTVLGSAATTVGCTIALLWCELTIFKTFGAVVLTVTFLSVFASLVPLPALLLLAGPLKRSKQGWCPTCFQCNLADMIRMSQPPHASASESKESEGKPEIKDFVTGVMDDAPVVDLPASWSPQMPGSGMGLAASTRPATLTGGDPSTSPRTTPRMGLFAASSASLGVGNNFPQGPSSPTIARQASGMSSGGKGSMISPKGKGSSKGKMMSAGATDVQNSWNMSNQMSSTSMGSQVMPTSQISPAARGRLQFNSAV